MNNMTSMLLKDFLGRALMCTSVSSTQSPHDNCPEVCPVQKDTKAGLAYGRGILAGALGALIFSGIEYEEAKKLIRERLPEDFDPEAIKLIEE